MEYTQLLEALGHHAAALTIAAQRIDPVNHQRVLVQLLQQGVSYYESLNPHELHVLTQQILSNARAISERHANDPIVLWDEEDGPITDSQLTAIVAEVQREFELGTTAEG